MVTINVTLEWAIPSTAAAVGLSMDDVRTQLELLYEAIGFLRIWEAIMMCAWWLSIFFFFPWLP
jgi:hypothetical protein